MGRKNEKAMFAKNKWKINPKAVDSSMKQQANQADNIRKLERHIDRINNPKYAMNPEAKKFAIKQYMGEIKDIQKKQDFPTGTQFNEKLHAQHSRGNY
jgi:hypothetical protein